VVGANGDLTLAFVVIRDFSLTTENNYNSGVIDSDVPIMLGKSAAGTSIGDLVGEYLSVPT
jgi:hypothetical protein